MKNFFKKRYDVIVAGGGLAGLISAICLSRTGIRVALIEKKRYPFHRVCGEYVSNEVLPFLAGIDADPLSLSPSKINKLLVTSPGGTTLKADLPLGGFGISRYLFDHFLLNKAKDNQVDIYSGIKINKITFDGNRFVTSLEGGEVLYADLVIGSFGKRANLDKSLNRKFFSRRSPYLAVKYHIRTSFPPGYIGLHNFRDGYCGISAIEEDKHCLCYMTTRQNLRNSGSIPALEKKVLYQNPHLKEIFTSSQFLFDRPEVINEISFDKKEAIYNHILMAGDAAGMIAPLCGNGMAMAIHSAKLVSDLIIEHMGSSSFSRKDLEVEYAKKWAMMFSSRLFVGRSLQKFFGNPLLTEITLRLLKQTPDFTQWLVRQTHGEEID